MQSSSQHQRESLSHKHVFVAFSLDEVQAVSNDMMARVRIIRCTTAVTILLQK